MKKLRGKCRQEADPVAVERGREAGLGPVAEAVPEPRGAVLGPGDLAPDPAPGPDPGPEDIMSRAVDVITPVLRCQTASAMLVTETLPRSHVVWEYLD